jgi:methionine biosynthesis protein MetW
MMRGITIWWRRILSALLWTLRHEKDDESPQRRKGAKESQRKAVLCAFAAGVGVFSMNGISIDRADFAVIAQWVKPGSRVLDLGCGDGALFKYLKRERDISGYGIEIDDANVLACVKNGVNVIQRNLEHGLREFEDQSFDYIVLSQTLQAMRNGEGVIREMLRVGREGIVTFPNFGYWRNRMHVLRGRMPVSEHLPYQWFDTPNIHLCTLHDFERFCSERAIRILERKVLAEGRTVTVMPNLLGALAIYHFGAG